MEMAVDSQQTILEDLDQITVDVVQELRSIKEDHVELKQIMSNILEENQNLTTELNELLSSREDSIRRKQDDMTDNLRQQISSLLLEKEQVATLWQESVASMGEFKNVKGLAPGEFVPKIDFEQMKNFYEQKISELEINLKTVQKRLDSQLQPARSEVLVKDMVNILETESGAMQIVKNLEEEVLALQNRLQQLERSKVKLEKLLKEKDQFINNVLDKNRECQEKVCEAVQIVEAALIEKDAALYREKETRDQMQKINQDIDDIVKDTEFKIKVEVANVKSQYDKRCQELEDMLRTAQEELRIKSLEIEKYQTKCELFESELDKFRKGNYDFSESNGSKLLILEKNLESTFQKLLLSEKCNIQLSSEKEVIKRDMEQLAEHYERILKAKDVERLTLESKVKTLVTRLDEVQLDNSGLEKKLTQVIGENDKIGKELMIERDDRKRQEKTYHEQIKELTKTYDDKINVLQLQLESKLKVHNKWVSETKNIIENLEKLVIDLKREVHRLRKENKRLDNELKNSKQKLGKCKEYLKMISRDVDNITCLSVDRKPETLSEDVVTR
ncbi:unnamed protein product [Acanthoscelides obtectus]|uniref:Uncharacterized protein n=1 Tax=Acanthoscelides obtectus TaxID=200917 RepID=A0A9P0NUM6_ACAOB|nr:unnamed protein product [Acanthoscelides obtectus]CAK1673949.1 hypothetical protein AOBTE_LOCUS29483 [Acanthoscelides obtectus]